MHPGVGEVAVLGVADEKWGEIGVAVVVPSADGQAAGLTAEALLGHLEGRCAKYRWPRHIFFWDALPKSGYGKITKAEVRRQLLERGDIEEAVAS